MGLEERNRSLGDLPLDCIAAIIGKTTPLDACRLAAVCHAFADAAKSELVWQALVPSDLLLLADCASGSSSNTRSKWSSWRELLEALARGIFLGGGWQKYLLLPSSGDVCRMLSVAGMGVTWGQDARFWKWEESPSSCFGKVAHLVAICWLEVFGNWSGSLTRGRYSASWRLKVASPQQVHFVCWRKPLTFQLREVCSGRVIEKQLDLVGNNAPNAGFGEWFEFEVGQIEVEVDAQQLHFEFSIKEVDSSYWKGGLYLDCLTLRPVESNPSTATVNSCKQSSSLLTTA